MLTRLLRPRSIAVAGGQSALNVIEQCQRMGYAGDIWPLHPTRTEMHGLPVYRRIADLPAAPDACFVGVNRALTPDLVAELAACGAGGAVCYASGFREADAEGARLQDELLAAAGAMPILGPNCYGFINYADGALLWPDQHGGRRLAEGETGVAILAQSSNLAINLTMQQRGLPLAYMLTAGNQVRVGLSDLALAVLDDPRVTALGIHIEGFDSVAGFEALAHKARALRKPVVVLKVGKSLQAQQATLSHTASLAGSQAASGAFLRRLGFGQVQTIPAFLETLKLLHVHGTLDGYALCSMSCSGGEASLMADAAVGRKVYFPPLSATQQAPVEAILGPKVTVNNPLDYQTYVWADEAGMTTAYSAMLANEYDLGILVLDFPHPQRCRDDDWAIALRAFSAATRATGCKTALLASLPENLPEAYVQALMQQGIPALSGMEEALAAAEVAADIGAAWSRAELLSPIACREETPPGLPLPGEETRHLAAAVVQSGAERTSLIRERGGIGFFNSDGLLHILTEAEAKHYLAQAGIPVPARYSLEAALSGSHYPLVAKKLGIAHKTESNAVRLNLRTPEELQAAVDELLADGGELLIEAMITESVGELIVGLVRDAQFGLVMTLGAGGIFVEILQDTATLLLPSSRSEVEQALAGLRIAPLFNGYRGKPKGDMAAAVEAILRVQAFALEYADTLVELDINPLLVCAAGKGVYAADALMISTVVSSSLYNRHDNP